MPPTSSSTVREQRAKDVRELVVALPSSAQRYDLQACDHLYQLTIEVLMVRPADREHLDDDDEEEEEEAAQNGGRRDQHGATHSSARKHSSKDAADPLLDDDDLCLMLLAKLVALLEHGDRRALSQPVLTAVQPKASRRQQRRARRQAASVAVEAAAALPSTRIFPRACAFALLSRLFLRVNTLYTGERCALWEHAVRSCVTVASMDTGPSRDYECAKLYAYLCLARFLQHHGEALAGRAHAWSGTARAQLEAQALGGDVLQPRLNTLCTNALSLIFPENSSSVLTLLGWTLGVAGPLLAFWQHRYEWLAYSLLMDGLLITSKLAQDATRADTLSLLLEPSTYFGQDRETFSHMYVRERELLDDVNRRAVERERAAAAVGTGGIPTTTTTTTTVTMTSFATTATITAAAAAVDITKKNHFSDDESSREDDASDDAGDDDRRHPRSSRAGSGPSVSSKDGDAAPFKAVEPRRRGRTRTVQPHQLPPPPPRHTSRNLNGGR